MVSCYQKIMNLRTAIMLIKMMICCLPVITPQNFFRNENCFTMKVQDVTHSGKSRGGSGDSNEPPFESKLFHFHGEFQEKLIKLHKMTPPTPLS